MFRRDLAARRPGRPFRRVIVGVGPVSALLRGRRQAIGPWPRARRKALTARICDFFGERRCPPMARSIRSAICLLGPRGSNWGPDQRNGRDKRPNSKWDKLMAPEKAQNLQDTFLNHVRKSKTSVTIFLVNGVKLQGFV